MATSPDQWTASDGVSLRTFIAENPKFLAALMERRPKIEGNTMESRAVTGSDCNGYLSCIETIKDLMQDPQAGAEDAGFLDR